MSDIQEEQKRLYKRAEENDIKLLQEENNNLKKLKERYQLEKEIYKSRIDKAIQFIDNKEYYVTVHYDNGEEDRKQELLDILKGDNK